MDIIHIANDNRRRNPLRIHSILHFDVRSVAINKLNEFSFKDGNVYCGSFLSERRVLIAIYSKNGAWIVYDKNWICTQSIDGLNIQFNADQFENLIFIKKISNKNNWRGKISMSVPVKATMYTSCQALDSLSGW